MATKTKPVATKNTTVKKAAAAKRIAAASKTVVPVKPVIPIKPVVPVKPVAPVVPATEAVRQITTAEYQFALTIFQREFPPRDEIWISNQTGLGGRPYVRPTIHGNIRIYIGALFNKCLDNLVNKSLFAHELTHAWQIEHYGLIWYGAQAFGNQVIDPLTGHSAYDYTCNPAKTLGDYNAEQQGEIIRNYVLGSACEKKIVEKTLISKTWKLLIGSDARDMAVDSDGTLYMVNRAGLIYKYVGNDWQKLNGSDGLAIAANGGKVFLVNTAGKIYERVNDSWKKLPGGDAVDITVATDGNVFMVNNHGKIYNYHPSTGWAQLPGSDAVRISTGHGEIWMVNRVGKIYKYTGSWKQMSGSDGRDIAVTNEGKVFLTNTAGKIYERTLTGWKQLDGSDGVAVAANKNKLVLVNTKGRMYIRPY